MPIPSLIPPVKADRSGQVTKFARSTAQITRQQAVLAVISSVLAGIFGTTALAQNNDKGQRRLKLVAFGDSLTAGYNLPARDGFPAQLERMLREKGHDVAVVNAGVSGDTTAAGLARFDWSLPDDADGVILELGANDALRGLDPKAAEQALDAMLQRLAARHIPALLAGMYAPRNLGPDYVAAFDGIYPRLARKHGVLLYPFFLEGMMGNPALEIGDGLHPNAAGVAVIAGNILPSVEALIARIGARVK